MAHHNPPTPSIISQLRSIMPMRPLGLAESLRIAELQAVRLLSLTETPMGRVPESVITNLPRVHAKRTSPLPLSGYAEWSLGRWMIVLNGAEPLVRQRFSLFHEFKHVIDHPFASFAYQDSHPRPDEFTEQVCDVFAACVLMPRVWVKDAYCNDKVQDLGQLARRFGVSQMAMRVRLLQIGLIEPTPRCAPYVRHSNAAA